VLTNELLESQSRQEITTSLKRSIRVVYIISIDERVEENARANKRTATVNGSFRFTVIGTTVDYISLEIE
jgi:hypothetical protein